MTGPLKPWFELPANAVLDEARLVSYLETHRWTDYNEMGEAFVGYQGIGLTSRSEKPEHINDALEVLQSVGDFEQASADYNWQAIDVWNQNVTDYVETVFKSLNLRPLRARFSKLQPRSTIPPHVDEFSENITRLHWPIVTDDKNFFCFYDESRVIEKVPMLPGRCYAVDTSKRHGFINFSKKVERIHLIINVGMGFQDFSKWLSGNSLFKTDMRKP